MADLPALAWSATFQVASPSKYPSKDVKGDKIILPQSALEQLLAASTASPASRSLASTSLDRNNPYASAATGPQHHFYSESHQQLPHPLMFRLVNQANGNAVHAGIREFSSEEDEMLLSPYLMEALGLDPMDGAASANGMRSEEPIDVDSLQIDPPRITVHAKQLPKGTYVRLRPLEAGYDPDDWKPLLERQLRDSYTTLTKGAFLSVHGVRGETFRFLVDNFRPEGDGICVVDTDLEVDIEALNEEQARETMRQIMAKVQRAPGTSNGSSVGQELNIWKDVDGQVLAGEYVDYELPSWARSRPLIVELSGFEDEYGVDLLVSPKSSRQRVPPRLSEHVFGVFDADASGVKRLVIQPTNVELEDAESLLISVYGYAPQDSVQGHDSTPRPFRIRVKNAKSTDDELWQATDSAGTEAAQHSDDEEQCKNCLQWVPKRSMVLHENFCRRNNVACPQCGGVFQKTSTEWQQHWHCPHDDSHGSSEATKAKHDSLYHSQRQCPSCPFSTNSLLDLARHRTTLCPARSSDFGTCPPISSIMTSRKRTGQRRRSVAMPTVVAPSTA
ncbi:ubiquitin fusion degradation protein UFD1-domain-containing protein [Xylariomycetidae sp. FL0641]|nr:ubiquitin fusion degradation protein UFD1-domain-containing protein [Xylariomycetidae sp. FL0641]